MNTKNYLKLLEDEERELKFQKFYYEKQMRLFQNRIAEIGESLNNIQKLKRKIKENSYDEVSSL